MYHTFTMTSNIRDVCARIYIIGILKKFEYYLFIDPIVLEALIKFKDSLLHSPENEKSRSLSHLHSHTLYIKRIIVHYLFRLIIPCVNIMEEQLLDIMISKDQIEQCNKF